MRKSGIPLFFVPLTLMIVGLTILLSTSHAVAATPKRDNAWKPLLATGVSTHGNINFAGRREEPFQYAPSTGDCSYCHSSMGGTPNLFTIKSYIKVATTGITTGPIVFTALTGSNSFDDGISSETSRICVSCHVNSNRPGSATAMSHTGGAGHFFGDYSGQNCTTCHPHDPDGIPATVDGFMIKVGACDSCHGAPPATGSHSTHSNPATLPTVYGETGIHSTPTAYDFSCGECHPTDVSKHMNGALEVALTSTGAPIGSLKAKNDVSAAYDKPTQTCSGSYCHSGQTVTSGAVGSPLKSGGFYVLDAYGNLTYDPYTVTPSRNYQTTPNWVSGSVSGNCTDCHAYPLTTSYPTVEAGVGDSHQWVDGDGVGNLHAWNMGYDPLQCNTCHTGEITATGTWSRDANDITTYDPVPIASYINHVNGTANVDFTTAFYTYPISNPPYTFTVDLNAASYDANTKSCGNVGCHLAQNYVVWGAPYRWQTVECDLCHHYGAWPPIGSVLPQTPFASLSNAYYDMPVSLGTPRPTIGNAYDMFVSQRSSRINLGNAYHEHTPPPPNTTCVTCHTKHAVNLDGMLPDTQIDSTPANLSASSIAIFTFSSPNLTATFECSLDGAAFSACPSGQAYSGLSDGSHTFDVRAKNVAGNTDSTPASYTWTIDTTAPDTQIISFPSNPNFIFDATFTFSSPDGDAVSFECRLDDAAFVACTSPQAYSGLVRGSHIFQVRAKDAAGNIDQTPASYAWTIYTISTANFTSQAANDGWVLESTETSSVGDALNSTSATLRLGDSELRQQYQSILSFNTSSLPDAAVVTDITISIKRQTTTGGVRLFNAFNGLMIQIKSGFFHTAASLQAEDFQAATDNTEGPFFSAPVVGNWYSMRLTNNAYPFINKLSTFQSGLTQFRLYFLLDDNDNEIANYESFFSGNTRATANRPRLQIKYYIP
jgi:hypothetical protein